MKTCPHCHKSIDGSYSISVKKLLADELLTKVSLAHLLGVHRQAIYGWINGEYSPSEQHQRKILESYPNAILQPNYQWQPEPQDTAVGEP
jgi:DNA-binding XRE family transcriptional regulator